MTGSKCGEWTLAEYPQSLLKFGNPSQWDVSLGKVTCHWTLTTWVRSLDSTWWKEWPSDLHRCTIERHTHTYTHVHASAPPPRNAKKKKRKAGEITKVQCSFRGPTFSSQLPMLLRFIAVTPAQGIQCLLLESTCTYSLPTQTYIIYNLKIINL